MLTNVALAIASLYDAEAADLWQKRQSAELYAQMWPFAQAHRFAPLLYHVAIQSQSSLREEDRRNYHQNYLNAGMQNTYLLAKLAPVVQCLHSAELPFILLKGAYFAPNLYPNIALRPLRDLDLLVLPQDKEATLHQLTTIGYQPRHLTPIPDPQGAFWSAIDLDLAGPQQTTIELHWRLIDNPYFARLWPVSELFGRSANDTLHPEDHLLHLCLHQYHHHPHEPTFAGLDIALLLHQRGSEIDWPAFLHQVQLRHSGAAVRTVLQQAADLWFAPIPLAQRPKLAALPTHSAETTAQRQQASEIGRVLRTLLTLPKWSLRLRFLRAQLLPSAPFLRWRYNHNPNTPVYQLYLTRYRQLWQHRPKS